MSVRHIYTVWTSELPTSYCYVISEHFNNQGSQLFFICEEICPHDQNCEMWIKHVFVIFEHISPNEHVYIFMMLYLRNVENDATTSN